MNRLRGLGLGFGLDMKKTTTHLPLDGQLSQASQDMQDMKDCYDTLLSSAAATANSAYEFSESLREMGDCLLQNTSLNDHHQDTGRVLLMLGKVQFQIQKLVDNYRAHISRTLTVPSQALLNELHIVEDMKRQCDVKRMSYDEMKTRCKYRTRLGTNKGDYVSSNQVRAAKEEFEEDAALFIFRMKSLKGGRSRSLLTQAARHHAAQMCFFRKALKSLETIEPHVQLVTQQHHIDYQFSGLEDDDDDDDRDSVFLTDDEDDQDESDDDNENGELSFNYQRNEPKNIVSSPENSKELDSSDLTFPQVAQGNSAKANMQQQQQQQQKKKPLWNSSTFNIAVNTGSKSAPLYAVSSNMDPSEKFRQMQQSSARKLNTYVLPTPLDKTQRYRTQHVPSTTNKNINNNNMSYSSPLESKKCENEKFSGPIPSKNNSSKPTPLPSPSKHVIDRRSPVSSKKVKRYAFSSPLAGIARSNNSFFSASGPIRTSVHTPQFSGSLLGTPLISTRLASFAGSFVSSPKISELHELPRPPPNLTSKIPPSNSGFSAPLMTSKTFSMTSELPASTFPVPPESQYFKAAISPPQTPVSIGNASSNLR